VNPISASSCNIIIIIINVIVVVVIIIIIISGKICLRTLQNMTEPLVMIKHFFIYVNGFKKC